MKLDINQVWQEASAMVSANREVLLTIAGVFFVLPQLIVAWLFPTPEIDPEMAPRAMLALLSEHFRAVAPWQALSGIASAIGALALLALITGRERPTVGGAIGQGLRGLLSYIATNLLMAMVFLAGALVITLVAGSTGSVGLALLLGFPALAGLLYLTIRWEMVGPVIAIEGQRNPISALQRSWELTKGNVGRILLYLVLLGLVYIVVVAIVSAIAAGLATVALGGEAGRFTGTLLGALLGGIFVVYLTASLGAMHRQLTGAADQTARRFD